MRVYRKLRWVLIPLILTAMVVSLIRVITIFTEYRESEAAYEAIHDQFIVAPRTPRPGTSGSVSLAPGEPGQTNPYDPAPGGPIDPSATWEPGQTAGEAFAPIGVDFEKLKSINKECVGWIYIPDTNVNFPVMRAENNSKYLNRLLDGTKNSAGSIFMDFRCNPDLSDRNVILYGHNMSSGVMFSQLKKYRDREFFLAHQTGYYLTPDADYELTIVVCKTVSATGEAYVIYEDKAEFAEYLKSARRHADVTAAFEPEETEQIFTLSTCTSGGQKRLVLLAIPKKIG